ncbi:MAG TPA: hypothetical protein VFB49_03170 [Patescibacteria group bacterium]|nr:hypothetical protein [Patescibacteria group bacterium]
MRASGFLLLVAVSVVDAWAASSERVATKHLDVARKLAKRHVDLSTDYGPLAAQIWSSDCHLTHGIRRADAENVRRFVELYSKGFCESWADFWHEGMRPCGERFSPAWCDFDTDIAERLDLVGYLAAMLSGLEEAPGIERANILQMTLRTLSARSVFEAYPLSLLEAWAGRVTAAYLRGVAPDQAVALAHGFHAYWFRTAPAVRGAFANYTDINPAISDAQKAAIARDLADDPDR